MIDDKQRLESYRAALVEAIVTIDRKTYGKVEQGLVKTKKDY